MTRLSKRTFVLGASAAALGGCGAVYTPDYLFRTLSRQDASSNDHLWKRSIIIPAATSPRALPWRDESVAVENVFASSLGYDLSGFVERSGTQSLLVVRRGALCYQRYSDGVTEASAQATFSISKSILSLLVGQALSTQRLRSLDEPLTTYVPELRDRDPRFDRITLANLIDMRSGIAFSDDLSFPFVNNDAPLVYYASDLREVCLTQTRIAADPGTFLYNDYNPNLLALALERALGVEELSSMRNALWQALGAQDDARWSVDNHDFPYWESGFVATPRDLAKIGQLLLTPVEPALSDSWLARISEARTPADIAAFDGKQWSYRAGWWLVLRPDGRHDIAAIGRFGQMTYVSRANDVVIVRTGGDRNAPDDGDLTSLFFSVANALGAAG
jgi:CubicO group peptidase (beta-lactamase class C family)